MDCISEQCNHLHDSKIACTDDDSDAPVMLQDIFETLMQSMDPSDISTELIIRVLGLTNCADTPLGNETVRGVSGGERKRVTLGEMLVGNKVLDPPDAFHQVDLSSDGSSNFRHLQILSAARVPHFCARLLLGLDSSRTNEPVACILIGELSPAAADAAFFFFAQGIVLSCEQRAPMSEQREARLLEPSTKLTLCNG